ncbi:Molybdopterin synthase sulfur carrier subunit [Varanus komodoensis]|nr:Molybdopterin synthase sulfur carrier subunit [Varanus komodoensis]
MQAPALPRCLMSSLQTGGSVVLCKKCRISWRPHRDHICAPTDNISAAVGRNCEETFEVLLAAIQDQVVFAVRQEYVVLGDQPLVLHSGDEVAVIPPISGG